MKVLSMLPAVALDHAPEGTKVVSFSLDFGKSFVPQVQAYFEGLGNDGRGVTHAVIVGQAVAACLALPALEMLGGLPKVALIVFGKREVSAWLDTGHFRHHTVRARREEIPDGRAFEGYTVLDGGGRGLTALQRTELAGLLGCSEDAIRVLDVAMGQVDLTSEAGSIKGVVEKLLGCGMTKEDWHRKDRFLFLPGGAGIISVIQALAIHGLAEVWPLVLRVNADDKKVFHLVEVVDAQSMRQWAVGLGSRLDASNPIVSLAGEIPEAFRSALAALAAEHGVEIRG